MINDPLSPYNSVSYPLSDAQQARTLLPPCPPSSKPAFPPLSRSVRTAGGSTRRHRPCRRTRRRRGPTSSLGERQEGTTGVLRGGWPRRRESEEGRGLVGVFGVWVGCRWTDGVSESASQSYVGERVTANIQTHESFRKPQARSTTPSTSTMPSIWQYETMLA